MAFIKDFKAINEMLANNEEFLNNGGANAADIAGGLESTSRLLYSVYLYLLRIGALSSEKMRAYLLEMCKYKDFGYTYEYHAVNAARLKIEENYLEPAYYCESACIKRIPFINNTFLALGAICDTEGMINSIIEAFDRRSF